MELFYIDYCLNDELHTGYIMAEDADQARAFFMQRIMSRYGATNLNNAGFRILDIK